MSLAVRLPAPVAAIDPKRIAATSLAIAVHAAVLMLLLVPMQVAEPPKAVDDAMVVTDIKPIPIPPKPPEPRPRPTTQQVVHTPPRTPPTHVEFVNDEPSPIDPRVEEVTLEDPPIGEPVVDTGPSFVELRADVAPPPAYPAQARQMRQQGRVTLRVLVDEAGRPAEVSVESSSGFRVLDEVALRTVKKRWHFVPATRDGTPIQAWALVPVVFELR